MDHRLQPVGGHQRLRAGLPPDQRGARRPAGSRPGRDQLAGARRGHHRRPRSGGRLRRRPGPGGNGPPVPALAGRQHPVLAGGAGRPGRSRGPGRRPVAARRDGPDRADHPAAARVHLAAVPARQAGPGRAVQPTRGAGLPDRAAVRGHRSAQRGARPGRGAGPAADRARPRGRAHRGLPDRRPGLSNPVRRTTTGHGAGLAQHPDEHRRGHLVTGAGAQRPGAALGAGPAGAGHAGAAGRQRHPGRGADQQGGAGVRRAATARTGPRPPTSRCAAC